jgi:hypothetical protein
VIRFVHPTRVEEGVARLDEAMTVARGGEASGPLACGDACCTTLVVCDGLADLHRAAQWCEAVVEFTERRRPQHDDHGRTHRAERRRASPLSATPICVDAPGVSAQPRRGRPAGALFRSEARLAISRS